MNAITDEFAEKTPVQLLYEHKRHMKSVCDQMIDNSIANRVIFHEIQSLGVGTFEGCMFTGSNAEGASLARQFSNDIKTATEVELDMMFVFATFQNEEIMTYVEDNQAFVHIELTEEQLQEITSIFGSETVEIAGCQRGDRSNANSISVKNRILERMRKASEGRDGSSFCPLVLEDRDNESNARGASIATHIDFHDQDPQDDMVQMQQLLVQLKPKCDEFEARIGGALTQFESLHKEFLEMRSRKEPLGMLVEKALEWATICIDIAQFVFGIMRSIDEVTVQKTIGIFPRSHVDQLLNKVTDRPKMYIDQLVALDDDPTNASVRTAVNNCLTYLEHNDIANRRYVNMYLVLTGWIKRTFCATLTHLTDRQLNQIPPELRQLGKTVKRFSFDIVPCFKLTFWPSVAGEWKTRDRVWPNQSVVDTTVNKGTHLVAKAYCHDDIDWRLSFSVAEIDLATRWSPAQHFVYFIFKALFYKFIKPISDDDDKTTDASSNISSKKFVASYTAKTVMMWTSESFQQSWWTENDAPECLTVLLLALQSAFECRTLTHYFISSVNLLEGVPDEVAHRVIDTVQSILTDPSAVVDRLESHFEVVKLFLNTNTMSTQRAQLVNFA